MRAMVLSEYGKKLELKEVPTPSPERGQVQVKVKAAGLCGSDLKIMDGKFDFIKLPHIPGHEITGEITAIGEGVSPDMLGKRIIAHTHHTCGVCKFCATQEYNMCTKLRGRLGFEMPGGLGEFLVMDAINTVPIPDNIKYTDACVIPCAMITTYHGINRAQVKSGDRVVLLGVGGLGFHAIAFLLNIGANVTAVDVKQEKLAIAKELGAHTMLSYDDFAANSELYDVIMDSVANVDITAFCQKKLAKRGRYLMVGYMPGAAFTFDSFYMHANETSIIGLRNGTLPELREIVDLVSQGKAKPIIDKVMSLEDANEVLDMIRSGSVMGRIVLTHND